ncbi:MAG: hypothetical protein ACJ77N_00955 [Chloroflexota bacterium]
MPRPSPRSVTRLAPALLGLALALGACDASKVPTPAPSGSGAAPSASAAVPVAVVPPHDPPPPTTSDTTAAAAAAAAFGILSPANASTVPGPLVVVRGVAASGAEVLRDVGFGLDDRVRADAWGAWSMPLRLDQGEQVLTFRVADDRSTAQRLRLFVAPPAAVAPTIVWPRDGATVGDANVTLRGSAAAGATVRLDRGGLEGAFGLGPSTTADELGRWALAVTLEPGANDVRLRVGDGVLEERVTVDATARPSPAPELEVVSSHILPVDDPDNRVGGQVAIEVRNVTNGWLALAGDGGQPSVLVAGGAARTPLLAVPARVAPGATALLLGELPGKRPPPTAALAIDTPISYVGATSPAASGTVETYRLEPRPGDGLAVSGRFRAGSADARFSVVVLAYDRAGRLLGYALSPASAPGTYDACCLPLFGRAAESLVGTVVGLVTEMREPG